MSLLKITPRKVNLFRFSLRYLTSTMKTPPELKVQEESKGYLAYTRNVCRDKRYDLSKVPLKGNTPFQFFTRRLGHAYEVYPPIFLVGTWFCAFIYVTYYSFSKVEIWLDRSHDAAPWDWSRIRENYWMKPTVLVDMFGNTHRRLEIMETLQDEMLEAAKKRGTRK